MHITLVLNPSAGDRYKAADNLAEKLARRGDVVTLIPPDQHLPQALREPADLVVAAGGDGTVARVVREMVGRETPVVVAPTGTANNIARSLGIMKVESDVKVITSKWRPQAVDVAETESAIIVESAGCGAIPHLIHIHSDDEREGLRREAKNLGESLDDLPAFEYRVSVDGAEITGEAILIEAMLIKQVGPNLLLAPGADLGDGMLDLVIVEEKDRRALKRYLTTGARRRHPELGTTRARSVTIACDAPWHFDDELKPRRNRTIEVCGKWRAMAP